MTSTSSSAPDLNDIVFNDWVEHWLPRSWRPYARLCRLDRPIGTWLTLLPCIAALVQSAGGFPSIKRLIVFSLGALLMRGIGCTVNDMWDRDIDKHVERTRFRPLTSGQLGMRQAVVFLIGQLAVCACLLFFINGFSRWLALAVLPFVFIYPFCKRVTYWPQVVLGICFNWGMLMAWSDTRGVLPLAGVAMWLGTVLWQVGYDSIYAYVDVRDDRRLNLHSTAMRFADRGKAWIGGFYVATLLLWTWAGHSLGAGGFYYLGMIALAAHLGWQLVVFDLQRPDRNFMLFRSNLWVGVILIAAALGGALL
jgi:4-hydroxybenzoate polyprenyltransferase